MKRDDFDTHSFKMAVADGGLSSLRFACDFAERLVAATETAGEIETLPKGFAAFRARNKICEYEDEETGQIHFHPLRGREVGAPPADQVKLGRFNIACHPVLYLSFSGAVALAEVRALPSDDCTVARLETKKPLKIARLLRNESFPLRALLDEEPTKESYEEWLMADAARFVSRRVTDDERDVHYRACNLISSAFRESGVEGLAYRTSFWSSGWRDEKYSKDEDSLRASNLVLFDPDAAIPVSSSVYRIDWKRPTAEIAGNARWKATS